MAVVKHSTTFGKGTALSAKKSTPFGSGCTFSARGSAISPKESALLTRNSAISTKNSTLAGNSSTVFAIITALSGKNTAPFAKKSTPVSKNSSISAQILWNTDFCGTFITPEITKPNEPVICVGVKYKCFPLITVNKLIHKQPKEVHIVKLLN
jgi:hypothetical protein